MLRGRQGKTSDMGADERDDREETYRRDETDAQRLDRNFAELLQELRVVETGVQIFFAFLLTIPFQARFPSITGFQKSAYLVTLIAAGCAAVLLVAPVAVHRVLFRQRRKDVLVRFAGRCAAAGLALMLVSMLAAVLLIVDVVVGAAAAWAITGFLAVGAIVLWYVFPLRWRREQTPFADDPG